MLDENGDLKDPFINYAEKKNVAACSRKLSFEEHMRR